MPPMFLAHLVHRMEMDIRSYSPGCKKAQRTFRHFKTRGEAEAEEEF